MYSIDLFSQNLLSPPILFFILGVGIGFLKSDLKISPTITQYLSIYLMMSIGFKGGIAFANHSSLSFQVVLVILGGLLLGSLQPFISYWFLRRFTALDPITAAAASAHYGSISVITFVTATNFLQTQHVIYDSYILGVLSLMEAPAIFSGLLLAHQSTEISLKEKVRTSEIFIKVFRNGPILLLLGSILVGWATGQGGLEKMDGFLVTPFQGMLGLFLLDMGLTVAQESRSLKEFNISLVSFCVYMPFLGAILGILVSYLIGLPIGTGFLFTILIASASYIAVPAAMKLALPQAKSSIYIPMVLGLTFPFNIVFGIPIYYNLAKYFLA